MSINYVLHFIIYFCLKHVRHDGRRPRYGHDGHGSYVDVSGSYGYDDGQSDYGCVNDGTRCYVDGRRNGRS